MAMRRPYKHQFRIRLYRHTPYSGQFGPWITVSIRINRGQENALQRALREMNDKAPEGWRYVID